MQICKSLLKVLLSGLICKNAMATGMAVGIENLYLQNNTNKQVALEVNNLPKDNRKIMVKQNSTCVLAQSTVFLPSTLENNSFAIILKNGTNLNAIVIDKDSKLALSSYAKLKFNYQGNVKNDNLLGYCNDKLQQSKFLSVNPESVKDSMPVFKLKNCSTSSSFVYVINNKKVKTQKKLDTEKISECITNN